MFEVGVGGQLFARKSASSLSSEEDRRGGGRKKRRVSAIWKKSELDKVETGIKEAQELKL